MTDFEDMMRDKLFDDAKEAEEIDEHLKKKEFPCELCGEWTPKAIMDRNDNICDKCLEEIYESLED